MSASALAGMNSASATKNSNSRYSCIYNSYHSEPSLRGRLNAARSLPQNPCIGAKVVTSPEAQSEARTEARPPTRPGFRRVDAVLRRFNSIAALSETETRLIEKAAAQVEAVRAGVELWPESNKAKAPRLLLSGWACRQRVLPDGRRQIFDLLAPGDAIGLAADPLPLSRASTVALTRVETADAAALRTAAEDPGTAPALARIVALTPAIEEERLMNHVVRLGRLTAYERVAHLFLELQGRLAVAGLADEERFPLPVTQEVLADALGLSVVHMNRVLQQLRRHQLIEMRGGQVILLDPQALADVTDGRTGSLPAG